MDVQQGRWTAEIDGDFVVFLIGAMAHDPVGSPEATRLLMTMSDMLGELLSDPSKGLLAFSTYGTAANGAVLIQYWRSFDALEAYARDPGAKHAPVWREWNRLAADERSGALRAGRVLTRHPRHWDLRCRNVPACGRRRRTAPRARARAMPRRRHPRRSSRR